jgi:hypothetical protein
LGSGTGPSISVLESRTHQDVIFAPVPEPSTVMRVIMGLISMSLVAMPRGAKA